ncbi:hypothetical protein D5R40_31105 [Okeania hirsuta]|uniref:Uncharacterized protein n=1 Tax=Okeania hirsuta TaxID=1458930 RepID=A0A3N6PCA5_9CYAN|nr:hypothetical protein D5R40_31105 [Okeania hirsuta]
MSLILVAATAARASIPPSNLRLGCWGGELSGSILIPLVLDAQVIGELYLGFLFVLSAAQLYLARKIDWQVLKLICLLV